jgi:hypothetical protein
MRVVRGGRLATLAVFTLLASSALRCSSGSDSAPGALPPPNDAAAAEVEPSQDAAVRDADAPIIYGLNANFGGQRIKARYWRAAGGTAAIFDALYDTVRSEDCTYAKLADGTTRCVPGHITTEVESLYYDGSCATPPIYGSTVGIAKYVGATIGAGSCDPRLRMFAVGASTTIAVPRQLVDGVCTAVAAPASATTLTELQPSTWYSATLSVGPGVDGLAARSWDGVEESSRFFAGWNDVAGSFPCAFTLFNTNEHRCLPTNAISKQQLAYFTDDTCTTSAGAVRSCDAPFVVYPTRLCAGTDATCIALGTAIPRPYVKATSCTALDPVPAGVTYRTNLDAAAPATFVLGTPTNVGAERIKVDYDLAGSTAARAIAFHDTTMGGFDCKPILFADGKTRCAPADSGGTSASLFSDPACTIPAFYTGSGAGSLCGPAHVPAYAIASGAGGATAVYSLLPAGSDAGTVGNYRVDGTGQCVVAIPPPKSVPHALKTPPANPDAFAEIVSELR